MDSNYVKEFFVLADELSFAKAAKKLFVSRPTLSAHISSLETEVRTPLLEKTDDGWCITPAGETFLVDAEKWLDELEDLKEHCRKEAKEIIPFTISAHSPDIQAPIEKAVEQINKLYTDKHFRITYTRGVSTFNEALQSSNIDAFVWPVWRQNDQVSTPDVPEGLSYVYLFANELVYKVSPSNPLYEKDNIEAVDLNGATILIAKGEEDEPVLDEFIRLTHDKGIEISFKSVHIDNFLDRCLLDTGEAIQVFSQSILDSIDIAKLANCKVFSLPDAPVIFDYYLVYRDELKKSDEYLLIEELDKLDTRG